MNNPLISIVIPVYNSSEYIDDTLKSVFNQSYQNWECIIINDGSTDRTEEIVRVWCKKDFRFNYFYKSNSGVSDSRNFGINKSKGDYIVFLDSDDVLTNDSIVMRLNTLLEQDVDLVFCNAYILQNKTFSNKPLRTIEVGLFQDTIGINKFLLNNNATTSTVLCKKSILKQINGFNWKVNAEDLYCWIELLINGAKFFGIEDCLVHYRVLDNSLSSDDRRCTKEIIEIIEDLNEQLIDNGVDVEKYRNIWIRNYILLKDDNGNILKNIRERIKFINKTRPNYFSKYLEYFHFPEKITKILVIREMNRKKILEF